MRDLIVVGSGIAGLFTALSAHRRGFRDVLIVTKAALEESTTRYAQGGIAAAVGDGDSWALHEADTLGAGAELCDPEAVRLLAADASERVADLMRHRVSDEVAKHENSAAEPRTAITARAHRSIRHMGRPVALQLRCSHLDAAFVGSERIEHLIEQRRM